MTDRALSNIAICGGGLAGHMCAVGLSHVLPSNINITFIETPNADNKDMLYGTVAAPETYAFLLSLGISEPELLFKTGTNFSLGTQYRNWGAKARTWVQSFHLPLPIFDGVDFHHYAVRYHRQTGRPVRLEPYIMSVQAACRGVFAHPPSERKIPLADVEYGYNYAPEEWAGLFAPHASCNRLHNIQSGIETVKFSGDRISSIKLTNGRSIEADLYIDCTGDAAKLSSKTARVWLGRRQLQVSAGMTQSPENGRVCRVVTGSEHGWTSETPLRTGVHYLDVCERGAKAASRQNHSSIGNRSVDVTIGRAEAPWRGNCLALGLSAAILEPLTTAPMTLLQRDVNRLLELIPLTPDMRVESREYNRRFKDDYTHAGLFQRAFFACSENMTPNYWRAAQSEPMCEKLMAKIQQFKSRGALVQYDHEPFNPQEWTMLHFGLGHIPERYDVLADRMPLERLEKTLDQMRMAILRTAEKMPPHEVYMSNLLKYLKDNHG